MNFQCFHVDVSRLHFREVEKIAAILTQHDALRGSYVSEMSVCVTCGAPCYGTTFRVLTRCSEYTTISLTSGALVSETTLCVTFSARRRSPPMRLLDRHPPILAARVAEGIRTALAGDRLGRQVRR